ncbi:unnamed protein product [Brassica oleracea]
MTWKRTSPPHEILCWYQYPLQSSYSPYVADLSMGMVGSKQLRKNVWYYCGEEYCSWFDTKLQKWKMVKGLEVLNRNCCAGALAIANYCGKLLILWDKPGHGENKNIWCSVIALERDRGGDDVWGHVEWASVVLTVPSSYVFLHCRQVWG